MDSCTRFSVLCVYAANRYFDLSTTALSEPEPWKQLSRLCACRRLASVKHKDVNLLFRLAYALIRSLPVFQMQFALVKVETARIKHPA